MAGFLGMRGTGDWVQDQRPKNWREGILFLYPNGEAPLTALTALMPSERTDDPEFNWWTKKLPQQGGAHTGVYMNSALSTAYTTAQAEGTTLYVKMAEAVASEFRAGHMVLLRKNDAYGLDRVAKVTAVTKAGANSYLTVVLKEADSGTAPNNLVGTNRVLCIGSVNPEGADRPAGISYDPVKFFNYTQIWRTPLSITRTAQKTKLRTGDAYKEMKREALELHAIEMERGFIYGVPSEVTGANGKPERTTGGIRHFIRTHASQNVSDFKVDAGTGTWVAKGKDWLNEKLELQFRYGPSERLGFCGSGALLGIQKLVEANTQYNISVKEAAYGIRVVEWVTPFGTMMLKTHPLFSFNETDRNSIMLLSPKNLRYRFIDDTFFKPDDGQTKSTAAGRDAKEEEFLTEAGLELHHPETFGMLHSVGLDAS